MVNETGWQFLSELVAECNKLCRLDKDRKYVYYINSPFIYFIMVHHIIKLCGKVHYLSVTVFFSSVRRTLHGSISGVQIPEIPEYLKILFTKSCTATFYLSYTLAIYWHRMLQCIGTIFYLNSEYEGCEIL